MKPDLTLLYSELGLKSNCSLAELQLAYRRRISELQPNRSPQSPESTAMLRDLISLYTTANRFHRRYGRLPGAAPDHPDSGQPQHAILRRPYSHYRFPSEGNRHPLPSPRIAWGLAVVLLVLLFGFLALASGEWLR